MKIEVTTIYGKKEENGVTPVQFYEVRLFGHKNQLISLHSFLTSSEVSAFRSGVNAMKDCMNSCVQSMEVY